MDGPQVWTNCMRLVWAPHQQMLHLQALCLVSLVWQGMRDGSIGEIKEKWISFYNPGLSFVFNTYWFSLNVNYKVPNRPDLSVMIITVQWRTVKITPRVRRTNVTDLVTLTECKGHERNVKTILEDRWED